MASQMKGHRTAPVHQIPTGRIVTVESPSIVRSSIETGLKSLGGEAQLKHVLEHRVRDSELGSKKNLLPEPVAGVSLRPHDPLAKRIPSIGVDTRNILVKVTVPKRTGRKRKRGSDSPFQGPPQPGKSNISITAPDLLQRLRDNEGQYSVEPVGMLHETHRFRTIPDFQMRNSDLPIMRTIRDHATIPDYDRLRNFCIDTHPGLSSKDTPLPAPPTFAMNDLQYKYEYQQAATVVFEQDEAGNITTRNLSAARKRVVQAISPEEEVPDGPPDNLPRSTGVQLNQCIESLVKLLDERPLITKRVALNTLPHTSESVFKEATQYVGYSFKAGPFRDCLIKYGIDPRKDPKYRFYQTMMFQLDHVAFEKEGAAMKAGGKPPTDHSSTWARSFRHQKDDDNPNSHIFDGVNITANGKTWQVIDITDPVLAKLFATTDLPSQCELHQWGWYHNGTMAKARTIMRDKISLLFRKEPLPEEDYKKVAEIIPDELNPSNWDSNVAFLRPREHGKNATRLSVIARSMCKNEWKKKGRATENALKGTQQGNVEGEAVGGSVVDDEELREADAGGEGADDDEVQEGQGDLDEQPDQLDEAQAPDEDEQGGQNQDGQQAADDGMDVD